MNKCIYWYGLLRSKFLSGEELPADERRPNEGCIMKEVRSTMFTVIFMFSFCLFPVQKYSIFVVLA
jgi:hypothetical protein